MKEGCEVWTDVAARGGNVRRPPPGGMGSSERQGTLAGDGGGGRAGKPRTNCRCRPQQSALGPGFSFQSWSWPPIHCTPTAHGLEGESRKANRRPPRERCSDGFESRIHSFTHSFVHSFILPSGKHFPSTHAVWKGVGSRAGSSCVSGSKQCLGRGQGSHGEEDGREFRFDGETTLSCGPPLGRSVPSTWALSVVAPGSAGSRGSWQIPGLEFS